MPRLFFVRYIVFMSLWGYKVILGTFRRFKDGIPRPLCTLELDIFRLKSLNVSWLCFFQWQIPWRKAGAVRSYRFCFFPNLDAKTSSVLYISKGGQSDFLWWKGWREETKCPFLSRCWENSDHFNCLNTCINGQSGLSTRAPKLHNSS